MLISIRKVALKTVLSITVCITLVSPLFSQDKLNIERFLDEISKERAAQLMNFSINLAQTERVQNNFEQLEFLNRQKLDSLENTRIQTLIGRVENLEARVQIVEKTQLEFEKLQDTLSKLDKIRTEIAVTTVRNRFLSAMQIANRISDESGDINALFDWSGALVSASSLTNPNEFDDFQNGLQSLKANQKEGFKLPDLDFLNTPFVNTVVSFISALGPKNKKNNRASELQKLNCVLEFAIASKQQLSFIESETEYLKRLNKGLNKRSKKLAVSLFGLVELSPGDISRGDFQNYEKLMSEEFIVANRDTIEKYIFKVLEVRQEYQNTVGSAIATMGKVKYALDGIRPVCEGESGLSGIVEIIKERKSELVAKVEAAEKTLKENFQEELSQQKVYLLMLPEIIPTFTDNP